MKLSCPLGHCDCDGHTVHKLSQRRLTADWPAPRENYCSQMHSKVSSDWLPSYIKVTQPVLEILKMAGYFPDSPRICSQNEYQEFCIFQRTVFMASRKILTINLLFPCAAFNRIIHCSRGQPKCDGTRWRTGEEVKGKLANGVGSQYSSHYLGTWCIQHYYRWCEHLGCQ